MTNELKVDPTKSLTYVFGAIHGNLDLLKALLDKVVNSGTFAKNDSIVFLGNLVDNGGYSKEVIEMVRKLEEASGGDGPDIAIIRGPADHSFMKMKVSYVTSADAVPTIASYRTKDDRIAYRNGEVNITQMQKDRRFFDRHHAFRWTEKFFFSFSGINPEKDLTDQNIGAMMFNNKKADFMKSDKDFGAIVVHCSPEDGLEGKIKVATNRINMFTDVCRTGVLACAVLNERGGEGTAIVEEVLYVSRDELNKKSEVVATA